MGQCSQKLHMCAGNMLAQSVAHAPHVAMIILQALRVQPIRDQGFLAAEVEPAFFTNGICKKAQEDIIVIAAQAQPGKMRRLANTQPFQHTGRLGALSI